jgi:c-di-GMP-binding flagellar brake protein YcgR
MTFDISTGGIRLQSKQVLSEGEEGIVEMLLPSDETVRAKACVVWKKPSASGVTDYGLRFAVLGPSELSAIFQAVNLRTYAAV